MADTAAHRPELGQKLHEVIPERDRQLVAGFNRGDPAAVAALYAEDATFLPGNREVVSGRAAIQLAVVRARKATQEDLPNLSETLAAAFFDDPVTSWCFSDATRRRQILPRFFEIVIEANLAYDEIYTTDDVVAGAVWVPPGVEDDGGKLVTTLGQVSGEYEPRLFEIFELLDEKHPHEPHYYLFFLGTRPERQSRGIGSALMRPVLEHCDREGVPAYLEATSERNKRLYLRHGFQVTGEIQLPSGPSLWCMWRAPR